MKRKKYIGLLTIIICFVLVCLAGCKMEEASEKKVKNLDYTICDESKLPDALVDLIMEKRKEPFKLTYRTKDYLYIVAGYGAQDRTDLGVTMTDLYLTENAIVVETDLVSKKSEVLGDSKVSYPWIAIKCELYNCQVVFR